MPSIQPILFEETQAMGLVGIFENEKKKIETLNFASLFFLSVTFNFVDAEDAVFAVVIFYF